MFYVSSRRGRQVGITDTTDNVEEFVSIDKLTCYIAAGVQIVGVHYRNANSDPDVKPLGRESAKFLYMQSGAPVRVKLDSKSPWKQCIFLRATLNSVFLFDGVMFELSYNYIDMRGLLADANHNDAIRVSELLRQVQAVS